MDELMEKYLQGKMTEAEQAAFEADLSPAEKVELASELGIKEALEGKFRNDLRNTVLGFEKNKPKAKRINPAYISIAASVVLAASLVFYFTSNSSTQSIYDQYYSPYPNYEVTALRGNKAQSNRVKAYSEYDKENYSQALSVFNELDDFAPADHFFQGICYIQLGQLDLALAQLNAASIMSNSEYQDASKWYTALVYIRQNKKEEAASILEVLANGNSEFATTAAEVRDKL